MGTLTVAQMENEIRSNLGERPDLNSRLFRFLNFAQTMICRQHDFRDLQTSTNESDMFEDGEPTYSLASVPRSIYSVRLIDGTNTRKLTYVPLREWDKRIALSTNYAEGRTSLYTYWNDTLEWFRVPNAEYEGTIRWSAWPTAFEDGSGEKSDYDNLDDVIISLASSWGFKSLGEDKKSYVWGNMAWSQLKSAIALDGPFSDADIVPIGEIQTLISSQYWADPFVKR